MPSPSNSQNGIAMRNTIENVPAEYRNEPRTFYHGTSLQAAESILRDGFKPSKGGLLGPGVYVAEEHKARRFALDQNASGQYSGRHGGEPALLEVQISFQNPKYVHSNDGSWQNEGHDACRAEHTSASTNMEWCLKSPSQVRVLRICRGRDAVQNKTYTSASLSLV